MDELLQAMSISDLETFKANYKANESIQKIVDGYIQVKKQELAAIKAKEDFGKAIVKLVDKLPHPADIANVYLAWREVEEDDTTKPEQVELVAPDGTKSTETRFPKVKVAKWVVELNKAMNVKASASGGTTQASSTKRAITVKKIDGDKLTPVGNFRNASEACKHLGLTIGGDSAVRVLQRDGYLASPYDGITFTVPA